MSTASRALALARRTPFTARQLSNARVLKAEAVVPPPAPNVGTVTVQTRPVGGFRGGVFGFLFGFSLASSLAAYHLLDEYKQASDALQASVDELQMSTDKISAHIRRIEAVEKDLKALAETSAGKEEVSKLRSEMKKLYDSLHVEFMDFRSHVWGIQQDVHTLSKSSGTRV